MLSIEEVILSDIQITLHRISILETSVEDKNKDLFSELGKLNEEKQRLYSLQEELKEEQTRLVY